RGGFGLAPFSDGTACCRGRWVDALWCLHGDAGGGSLRSYPTRRASDVRAVVVTASGSASGVPSTIKLNALTSFSDAYGGDTNLGADGATSRLHAYASGVLQTPVLDTLSGVYLDKDAASSINTAHTTQIY